MESETRTSFGCNAQLTIIVIILLLASDYSRVIHYGHVDVL
jgi:hypothetical protein